MDIHRYFHPHHNPRLLHTSLRLQEFSELEQAAIELKKAVVRAQIRTANAPIGAIRQEHFSEIIVALDFVIDSLETIIKVHPGDDSATLMHMVEERKNTAGWENWAQLVKQRMVTIEKELAPSQEALEKSTKTG